MPCDQPENTGELDTNGKTQIGFDFATTEESGAYNECGSFTKVYGAHVLDVEYRDNLRGTFAPGVCAEGDAAADDPSRSLSHDPIEHGLRLQDLQTRNQFRRGDSVF